LKNRNGRSTYRTHARTPSTYDGRRLQAPARARTSTSRRGIFFFFSPPFSYTAAAVNTYGAVHQRGTRVQYVLRAQQKRAAWPPGESESDSLFVSLVYCAESTVRWFVVREKHCWMAADSADKSKRTGREGSDFLLLSLQCRHGAGCVCAELTLLLAVTTSTPEPL
jgi:hypothetical protein